MVPKIRQAREKAETLRRLVKSVQKQHGLYRNDAESLTLTEFVYCAMDDNDGYAEFLGLKEVGQDGDYVGDWEEDEEDEKRNFVLLKLLGA